uniref:Uncharacterized protein n=1 Tax=Takifugu rubripes TaxID=31033 RepID=A0A674NCM6_TAKRU
QIRHCCSMQAKHQSLLKRVDALYEECEELQGLLGECEDKQSDLLNQLRLMTEEKERVHAQLTEQQVEDKSFLIHQLEKQTLQADASQLRSSLADLKAYVQTLEERERLNPLPARPESRKISKAAVEHSWETAEGRLGSGEVTERQLGRRSACPPAQLSRPHIRNVTFKPLTSTWTTCLSKVTSNKATPLFSGGNEVP